MIINRTATAARLRHIAVSEGGEAVASFLSSLTHAQHRAACAELSQQVLPQLPTSTFWQVALALVRHSAKAYLITVLKAAPTELDDAFARHIVTEGSAVDVQKTIATMLPRQTTPEGVERLFHQLGQHDPASRATYLLQSLTRPAAYVLFQDLRRMEDNRDAQLSICRRLIKLDTSIAWGLASLARTYFDLPELTGTFSLVLQPYELARLETSYAAFCSRVM